MPQCRNCHKTISSLDKDLCPYCGTPDPIESGYKTQDVTQFVDPVTGDFKLYKSKSRKTAGLLELFLGPFGAPFFYLSFAKKGILMIAITLAFTLGIGFLLFFVTSAFHNALAFVLPFLLVWLCHMIGSIYFFKKDSLKDGKGEFLR